MIVEFKFRILLEKIILDNIAVIAAVWIPDRLTAVALIPCVEWEVIIAGFGVIVLTVGLALELLVITRVLSTVFTDVVTTGIVSMLGIIPLSYNDEN